MHSLSLSSLVSPITARSGDIFFTNTISPIQLRFCGLRKLPISGCKSSNDSVWFKKSSLTNKIYASLSSNGTPSKGFDYNLVIIGVGVGGHGAALHAVEKGLKTAIIEGDVVGGTCVNRGCVPSKALLAISGRMRELRNEQHMKSFGLQDCLKFLLE